MTLRTRRAAWMMLCLLSLGGTAAAEPVITLDEPVAVVLERTDRERIRGAVTGFDAEGITLRADGAATTIAWSDVRLRSAQQIIPRVIDPRDPGHWLTAGSAYRRIEGGLRLAEQAFDRARRLDPGLAERVDALRGAPIAPDGGAAAGDAEDGAPGAPAADRPEGPQTLGAVPRDGWPEMTDAQHQQFFEHYDAVFREHLDELGLAYGTIPTDHFVVYSDLDPAVARRYAALLERMYDRLIDMFSLEEDTRVYAGKAFVLICRSEQTYAAFNQRVYGRTAAGSLGVCWQAGDGRVQMSAWQDPDDPRAAARSDEFLHTLVHENVHGFLFRYRSPVVIPNWANEGLAEWIAEAIIQAGVAGAKQRHADRVLRDGVPVGPFFRMPNIDAWHYGLAYGLTALMIRENRGGYRDFIHAIKDGTPWPEALAEHYGGVTPEGLIELYKREQRIVR